VSRPSFFLSVCLACLALWAVVITKDGEALPTGAVLPEPPTVPGGDPRDTFMSWRA
jgi:hypothetical protein